MNSVTKIIATGLAVALSACGSAKDANKDNFRKAIQAHLDTQKGLCAAVPAKDLVKGVPFVLQNRSMFGNNKDQADALADIGLLSKRDTETKGMFGSQLVPATEYQVSDLGKKFLVAEGAQVLGQYDAFCTGKYVVEEVQNFTEPTDNNMMGVKVSRVNYRYKVEGVADWAKAEKVRAQYKNFAEQIDNDLHGEATLILTNEGWVHERLFRTHR